MSQTQNRFLDQFPTGLVPHIIEFGKRLSAIEADVIVVMARKAACFVECLQQLKLSGIKCSITSDRILDMDTSWLKGKRVVLVDDVIISGTSLYRVINELKSREVLDVRIITLCVGKASWSRELVQPEAPYVELTDDEVTNFSASMTDALSVVPRPFNVDFPLYMDLRIPRQRLDDICATMNWEYYDVSSSLQESYDIFSITTIPTATWLTDLNETLGWNFSDYSQLLKVRIYGYKITSNRQVDFCNVLPIVVLDPLAKSELNTLFEAIMSVNELTNDLWRAAFSTHAAQLRFVQYVLSARLGYMWLREVESILDTQISPKHDTMNLNYLFPPYLAETIQIVADQQSKYSPDLSVFANSQPVAKSTESRNKQINNPHPFELQNLLTTPFIELYRTKERPARELISTLAQRVFDYPEYKDIIERLDTGLSLRDMRYQIDEYSHDIDVAKFVSLFTDVAIDCGIIVPIIVQSESIYRAFRHGENIRFGLSEVRLSCIMLERFARAANRTTIPHLWVEKMLVLLIKLGLHKRFLVRWNKPFEDYRSAGIRFSLKGAVVQSGASSVYKYNPEGAITSTFVNSGYLELDEKKNQYLVGRPPDAPIRNDGEEQAIRIGHMFGLLLASNNTPMPSLSPEELILLATCLTPQDTAGALAASIDIFIRNWFWSESQLLRSMTEFDEYEDFLKTISSRKIAIEAVSSGAWKYVEFMGGKPHEIIDRIADSWEDADRQATWRGFWSWGTEADERATENIRQIVTVEGVWCLRVNILIRLLKVSACYKAAILAPDNKTANQYNRELNESLKDIYDYIDALQKFDFGGSTQKLVDFVEDVDRNITAITLNDLRVRRFAVFELRNLNSQARGILDRVDTSITPFGRLTDNRRYSHAMYLNFHHPGASSRDLWKKAMVIIDNYRRRSKENVTAGQAGAYIDKAPVGYMGFRRGRWLFATGSMARRNLVGLAHELCKQFRDNANLRIVLFPNLSTNETVYRANQSSDYVGTLFWRYAHTAINHLAAEWLGIQLSVITLMQDIRTNQAIDKEIRDYKDPLFKLSREQVNIKFGVHTRSRRLRTFTFSKPNDDLATTDVGIITVVTQETQAVTKALSQYGKVEVRRKRHSYTCYEGFIPSEIDGIYHSVVCIQQLEQGNRSVITAFEALRDRYAPRLVVLLGIAGAIHKDLDLCDVVICDEVIYYDKRKETEIGTKHRMEHQKIPAWLKDLINVFFVKNGEPAEFPAQAMLPKPNFNVMRGPLGSGEAVLAYRDAEERQWLESVNDKTLALETEAGGLVQAFYESALSERDIPDGFLIIRGISDHADKEKNDLWRSFAADNAMTTLVEFLKELPKLGNFLDDR